MTRLSIQQILLITLILSLFSLMIWSQDFTQVAAGVALFLFGMTLLENGFKALSGGILERILKVSTARQSQSVAFGLASTTLMQSSSLVSLITVSFVSAQMITLAAGIGIIMGANLGTTTGAWLMAGFGLKVDIAAYALPLLVIGVLLQLQKGQKLRGLGAILLGIAFLFLGIHYMKLGFESLQGTFDLSAYAMTGLLGVLVFTLIGMIITTIMQSSHASLLIIISALATGQVSYENALALAIGANLGSTITIVIGAMAANAWGKRLAWSHVVFNIGTALIAIVFINVFVWLVDGLAGLLGIAPDNYLLKLALFHTLFNLTGVLLLWPFVPNLADGLTCWVSEKQVAREQPRFVLASAISSGDTARQAVALEVGHLFDNSYGLIAQGIGLRRSVIESEESLTTAVQNTRRFMPLDLDGDYEQKVKNLHNAIVEFIGQAQQQGLPESVTENLYQLRRASLNSVQAVKAIKHMHKNLVRYGVSDQAAVRQKYDMMRIALAKLLRALRRHMQADKPLPSDQMAAFFSHWQQQIDDTSRQVQAGLDQDIRQRALSAYIATSIMNDEMYWRGLANHLLLAMQLFNEAQKTSAKADNQSELDAVPPTF
ncbi:Na/Pi cotransporter family protein [Thiomicrospira sp. ALE5]|uniref:Na/Pi cotransporter family protein n=1 Tax=Thiomicrospira sp. ALE5 TaxID=748650 RepID=UPI0008EEFEDB|nr:Na/Pi symporter [Thiomicrospira sp. ALE5]SFR56425.1 phosphate:Na+ symporter [Thiomicrospira sp. ALE5]